MAQPLGMGKWWVALLAAATGVILTGVQSVERITLLNDPSAGLVCDVNEVLSCSQVLDAWQSSVVLGIPNAFIGGAIFAILGSAALSSILGSTLSRAFLLAMWALALFFAVFATWYMLQTGYVIGALCLWCIGNTTAVGVIGAVLTRTVAKAGHLGAWASTAADAGLDVMVWLGWWLALAALVAIALV
jgi:uncharacterized membrane protein